jgi:hypothetical protein
MEAAREELEKIFWIYDVPKHHRSGAKTFLRNRTPDTYSEMQSFFHTVKLHAFKSYYMQDHLYNLDKHRDNIREFYKDYEPVVDCDGDPYPFSYEAVDGIRRTLDRTFLIGPELRNRLRMKMLKENLMQSFWSTARVEKMIESGFDMIDS